MEVIAWGPTLDAARATQGDGEHMAFDELFANSDVLSIHELLLEQWLVLIAARELELIQESFFLVNSARGAIVDQDVLMVVRKDRAIAGLALGNIRARMMGILANMIHEVVLSRHHP